MMKFTKYLANLFSATGLRITSLSIPLLWILLTFNDHQFLIFNPHSQWQLQQTQQLVDKFIDDHQRLPESLEEIRSFSRKMRLHYSPYDRYGERLLFAPLGDKAFLLQSFGNESPASNRLSQRLDFILKGVDELNRGIHEIQSNKNLSSPYQGSFLEGLKSPDGKLTARLMVNTELKTHHLLITSSSNINWIALSSHDQIFEFLWLNRGNHELIFVAEDSSRYDQGLYYWNLETGEIVNLMPQFKEQFWPKASENQAYFLSLSHNSTDRLRIYFFAKINHEADLNPEEFYNFSSLYAINLDRNLSRHPNFQKINKNEQVSIFDYPLNQAEGMGGKELGRNRQIQWAKLPLTGDPEKIINAWQEYGSETTPGPMTPYQLWWLASMYNDAFRYFERYSAGEAQVLRHLGIKIAEALESFSLAPSYLRAMGTYLKKSLLLSQAANYNVTTFRPE